MTKKNLVSIALAFSMVCLHAQFQAGLDGGLFSPIEEESGMFRSTVGGNANLYYNTPINLMIGVHYTLLGKMKLSDNWATETLMFNNVKSNTAYLRYEPMMSLSLQYLIHSPDKKTTYYFGLHGTKYTYSANGKVVVNQGGSNQTLEFLGEKYTEFGLAPKFGLMFNILQNFKIDAELKYHHMFADDKKGIFNINVGVLYVFKKKEN